MPKTSWTIVLLATILASNSTAAPPPLREFFRPAPDLAAGHDPAKVYPQGQIFPFGFFGLNTARDKPEGLTLLGPYGKEANVAEAKQLGIHCTYTIGLPMNFLGKQPLKLSPDEIRQGIREQVEKAAVSPEIAWWYLQPEELRFWRGNEMRYLEIASETIRQTDPLKRPIWMYEPNHRGADALARTLLYLDICGKGMYTNFSGQRESRAWVRWTIEQEIEAIAKARPSAIPIAVPEMFQEPPQELVPMIPRWVRHDVYLSLITGAKGVMVFSGWRRPKFTSFEAYYQAYAQCARELSGADGLGRVFLFGERRSDIQVAVVSGPERVALSGKLAVEYPSVSFLDVAHLRDRYLFLANSANEAVEIKVDGLPASPLQADDVFQTAGPTSVDRGSFQLRLEPLEVRAFRFRPAEAGTQ
jgi:hypothetical protein